jgi:microcystin-dependent protein
MALEQPKHAPKPELWDDGNANIASDAAIVGSKLATAVQEALFSPGDLRGTARPSAASGWLLCNGSAVSRTTYASLFDAIGTAYGAGDGSTTFNLPDLRGRVPVGVDGWCRREVVGERCTRSVKRCRNAHAQHRAEMPSHTHAQNAHRHYTADLDPSLLRSGFHVFPQSSL